MVTYWQHPASSDSSWNICAVLNSACTVSDVRITSPTRQYALHQLNHKHTEFAIVLQRVLKNSFIHAIFDICVLDETKVNQTIFNNLVPILHHCLYDTRKLLFPFHEWTLRLRLHVPSMSPFLCATSLIFLTDTLMNRMGVHWHDDGDFDGHGDNDVTCKETFKSVRRSILQGCR